MNPPQRQLAWELGVFFWGRKALGWIRPIPAPFPLAPLRLACFLPSLATPFPGAFLRLFSSVSSFFLLELHRGPSFVLVVHWIGLFGLLTTASLVQRALFDLREGIERNWIWLRVNKHHITRFESQIDKVLD